MCMSYSGRCLLSNYMANRDANRGDCAQPCRWNYTLMEEKRPGEHYPIYEDERGTYIFNSKDLCLIDRIPQLISAGVDSLKIEGRMKSLYYVASVVRTYRLAIDEYVEKGSYDQEFYRKELTKVSHRDYTEGFAFDKPSEKDHNYDTTSYIRDYDFVAMVTDYNASTQTATLQVRNKISEGDVVEILSPQHSGASFSIQNLRNEEGESIPNAPHPQQKVFIQSDKPLTPWDLIRKKR
ncbi:MAG TPA: hypothetical protein DHN33_03635 [Eubacteriaceae bacterium]|nr:hypothetical protein [Eubacteriaceae bacterium]